MKRVLAILVALSFAAFGSAQRERLDAKTAVWVKADFDLLKSDGLLVGYPDGLGYPSPIPYPENAFEDAVAVHATVEHCQNIIIGMVQLAKSQEPDNWKAFRSDLSGVAAIQARIPMLRSLAKEFRKELDVMGEPKPITLTDKLLKTIDEIEAGAKRVQSLVPPFPDVPKDHWAAKAVEELHQLGILDGYPDGNYRG